MRLRLLTLALLSSSLAAADAQAPLTLVQTIDLPDIQGRIDHLAVDSINQRLFVAALGNNTVEVIDLRSGAHLRSLSGFREPQGIAVADDGATVAVANGESGTVQLLDRHDFHAVQSVAVGADADNVRYDSPTKRFFVGYDGGIAAISATDGQRLGEVKIAGHAESFQLERAGSRIFVNVPSVKQVAVLDRAAMKALTTWPVEAAESNYPMALDEADHRLFLGCRRPPKVLVHDTLSGKLVTSFDVVGDTDDLFYDATRKRLYVSGGEGFLDAFQLTDADHPTRIGHVRTAAGARTSLFIADRGRLYLAVPHRGAQKAEIRVYETRD